MADNSIPNMSYLTRPPRLPIPIEEDLKTPGSPIAGPMRSLAIPDEDLESGIGGGVDGGDVLTDFGPASGLSSSSAMANYDDDYVAHDEHDEHMALMVDDATEPKPSDWAAVIGDKKTVPTRIEWLGGGDKVWVTGSIFRWKKKKRLSAM